MDRDRRGVSSALRRGIWQGLWGCLFACIVQRALADGLPVYPLPVLPWSADYSYLAGRADLPFPLALKYVPLGFGTAYVSFGGQYRVRLEHYEGFEFGLPRIPDFTTLSHRALLHADLHLDSSLRAFLQLGYSDEHGRRPVERPFDRGGFDLAQGFIDWSAAFRRLSWRLRVGRQEIAIGRYVTIREGTTIERTFDGARLDARLGGWDALVFAARPTLNRPHAFDDRPDPSDFASGAVVSHLIPGTQDLHLDFLALQRRYSLARFWAGEGRERQDSVAARLHGRSGDWDIDLQASYQFGRFTPAGRNAMTIGAWGVASETGYTFHSIPASPTLSLRADVAAGDRNPRDQVLSTFDLPYPNLTYLTDAAIIAPRNVWDLDPFLTVRPLRALTVAAGSQFLWRYTSHDAVYTPTGLPLLRPGGSGNFIATQPYLRIDWEPVPYMVWQSSVVAAQPGAVVRAASGRRQVYVEASLTVRF